MPRLLSLALALAACDTPAERDSSPPAVEPSSVVLLSPGEHLVRAAMAIKGTRPSVEEMQAVAADPGALEGIVAGYLDDPLFGETVRDIENETLLVRVERSFNVPDEAGEVSSLEWVKALFEEPLKLIEYVAVNDLPYTDIVTSDETLVTPLGPYMWAGLHAEDFDPEGEAWQRVSYRDGRPTAGVLSTGGWNMRVASNPANAHRQGAAAAAAAMLCTDFLSRDVQLGSVDLTDEAAITDAILTDPSCVSCHQTLDPLAGFFFGFAGRGVSSQFPIEGWTPDQAGRGEQLTGRSEGYFGLGGGTLTDVGLLMAEDHRFTACAARRYLAWFTQTPLDEVPLEEVAAAQGALLDGELRVKEMVRHIVLSDHFAASHAEEAEVAEDLRGRLRTRPEQLDRMMRDLVGFTWETPVRRGSDYAVNLLTTWSIGFKVHGGSVDSVVKVTPVHAHSASAHMALRGFAEEAAGFVVEQDFALPAEERRLLSLVEPDTLDAAALRAQLAYLHLRVLAEPVAEDSAEVDESLALFEALYALNGDPATTWKLVLTAMFQDHRVAYH